MGKDCFCQFFDGGVVDPPTQEEVKHAEELLGI